MEIKCIKCGTPYQLIRYQTEDDEKWICSPCARKNKEKDKNSNYKWNMDEWDVDDGYPYWASY